MTLLILNSLVVLSFIVLFAMAIYEKIQTWRQLRRRAQEVAAQKPQSFIFSTAHGTTPGRPKTKTVGTSEGSNSTTSSDLGTPEPDDPTPVCPGQGPSEGGA